MYKLNPLTQSYLRMALLVLILWTAQSCKKNEIATETETTKPDLVALNKSYQDGPSIFKIQVSDIGAIFNDKQTSYIKTRLSTSRSSQKMMSVESNQLYEGFAINVDSATVIKDKGHTMYVFPVKSANVYSLTFQNLTVDESADGSVVFITTYTPTTNWIVKWKAGNPGVFDGNIDITYIKPGTSIQSLNSLGNVNSGSSKDKISALHGNPAIMLAQVCTTTTFYYSFSYTCASGQHGPGDQCGLSGSDRAGTVNVASTQTTCVNATDPNQGGGGGGGGTTPVPPGTYNPCPTAPVPVSYRKQALGTVFAVREGTTPCDPPPIQPSPTVSPEQRFVNTIDGTALSPCFSAVLNDLKNTSGLITALIKNFDTQNNQYYNWKVQDSVMGPNFLGETQRYNRATRTVTTFFDVTKFKDGSDLAIAKTILHEVIHAYMVSYFASDPEQANFMYSEMVNSYSSTKGLGASHHEEFVRSMVGEIAIALQFYGDSKGYTFASSAVKTQFYQDLAWGGLQDTNAFQALSQPVQNRIKDTIYEESNGQTRSGVPTALHGKKSGC
jgi:hypothetical protein